MSLTWLYILFFIFTVIGVVNLYFAYYSYKYDRMPFIENESKRTRREPLLNIIFVLPGFLSLTVAVTLLFAIYYESQRVQKIKEFETNANVSFWCKKANLSHEFVEVKSGDGFVYDEESNTFMNKAKGIAYDARECR